MQPHAKVLKDYLSKLLERQDPESAALLEMLCEMLESSTEKKEEIKELSSIPVLPVVEDCKEVHSYTLSNKSNSKKKRTNKVWEHKLKDLNISFYRGDIRYQLHERHFMMTREEFHNLLYLFMIWDGKSSLTMTLWKDFVSHRRTLTITILLHLGFAKREDRVKIRRVLPFDFNEFSAFRKELKSRYESLYGETEIFTVQGEHLPLNNRIK